MDEQVLAEYAVTLSNWRRWGGEDELGTLNLITDRHRLRGRDLIRTGTSVSCARDISAAYRIDNPDPMLHHMIESGAGAGQGFRGMTDWFGLAPHGFAVTHLDALNHVAWNGLMYNGRAAALVTTRKGGPEGAIRVAASRIAGRGVLLDVPAARGVDWLDIGDPVRAADLDACERRAGTEVGPGDILLVRTGRDARQAELGAWDFWADGSPGLHPDCLPWLRERDVAVLGCDAAQDAMPSGFPSLPTPIHAIGIAAMGLWLLDNAYLEELAIECARLGRWEFFCMVAPLRMKTATGCPVNPIAVL